MKKQGRLFYRWILILVTLLAVTGSCQKKPETPAVETRVGFMRFEEVLFSEDPATLEDKIPAWKNDFGVFLRHYSYIMQLGNIDDPAFPERLRIFAANRYNYQLYTRTKQVFPDLTFLTEDLSEAFGYYKGYFPDKPVPELVTFISGFKQSAITDDSLLAIGLDKYLGRQEPLYKQAGIYNYLVVNMYPGKIASDCMIFWGETEFPFHDSINNLITNMIYKGRLLHFANTLMPGKPDSLVWGFTARDLDYFRNTEESMWTYLVDQKLLFSTDLFTINKFILEGPYTKDFGRGSPARAAVWIGYRIIQSYLSNHPEITFQDLMKENDYLKILNGSAYNP